MTSTSRRCGPAPAPSRFLPLLLLALGIAGLPGSGRADVVSWDLERREWSTQLGSTPIVGAYQLSTAVTGTGLADPVTLRTPTTPLPLPGSSIQRSASTNITPASSTQAATNLAGAFETAFPPGPHQLSAVILSTNPITGRITSRTNLLSVNWTNGFPATAPVVTNVAPPAPLQARQLFQWPAFGGPDDFAAFYVLEGSFDTNLLASLAAQGLSALTNFTVRHASARLPAGAGSVTVTNLDTALDHLVWLEFHRTNPEANAALGEVDAVRANLMFHRRASAPVIVVHPKSVSAPAGSTVTLEVTALGPDLAYQWFHDDLPVPGATLPGLDLPSLDASSTGSYVVTVSNASGSTRSQPATVSLAGAPPPPTAPGLQLSSTSSNPGAASLTLRLEGAPSTRYRVLRSDDLRTWSDLAELQTDTTGTGILSLRALGSARFLRAVSP